MSFFIFLHVQPSLMKILQGVRGLKSQVLEIIHIPPYGISDKGRGVSIRNFSVDVGANVKMSLSRK